MIHSRYQIQCYQTNATYAKLIARASVMNIISVENVSIVGANSVGCSDNCASFGCHEIKAAP